MTPKFPQPADSGQGSSFLIRVEAVRGLAALMVTLFHAWLAVGDHWEVWVTDFPRVTTGQGFTTKLLLAIFNGQAAVTMFFVISGFVLGLSLDRGNPAFLQNGIAFIVRRIFRIYPAHVLVVLCTTGYLFIHHVVTQSNGSGWLNSLYYQPLSGEAIGENALLVSYTMNPAAWTLVVEIVASLLLPFLHFVNRRVSTLQDLGVLALLILASYTFREFMVLRFLFAFYAGLMIPSWGRMFAERLQSSIVLNRVAFWTAFCTFWLVRTAHGQGPVAHPIVEYTEGITAAMILAIVVYGTNLGCFRLLDQPFIRFYGRVSYSFYLWHVLVIYVVSITLFAYLPEGFTLRYPVPVSVAISTAALVLLTGIAALSYVCVEKPFIRLGKDLTGRIRMRRYVMAE